MASRDQSSYASLTNILEIEIYYTKDSVTTNQYGLEYRVTLLIDKNTKRRCFAYVMTAEFHDNNKMLPLSFDNIYKISDKWRLLRIRLPHIGRWTRAWMKTDYGNHNDTSAIGAHSENLPNQT